MKRIVSLLLTAVLLLALAACGQNPAPTPADPVDMNVYVLAGPTGIGAVHLRSAAEAGEKKAAKRIHTLLMP